MTEPIATPSTCPNCQSVVHGPYCFSCGQNQKPINRQFWTLVAEFFEEVFAPNSKAALTLSGLFLKPGYLSREYFSGRKARYIQPVRLYLTLSITFFFLISVTDLAEINTIDEKGQPIVIDSGEINIDANWSFLTPEESDLLNQRLNQQLNKGLDIFQNDPNSAVDMAIDNAPPVLFCLVPLFALYLKLTYLGRGRYYTEHLVLALHNHSFLFLALLLDSFIDLLVPEVAREWLKAPLELWIPIYLFLSLRWTFNDGWFVTFFKFLFLGWMYWITFFIITFIAVFIGVMSL